MTPSKTQSLITLAKWSLYEWTPYLTHVFSTMQVIETDKVPTMAVDRVARLYVRPDFVATLTKGQVAYVLLHEVMHVTLFHHRRLDAFWPDPDERQRLAWNIGGDLVIQQMLSKWGEHEPDGIVNINGKMPGSNVRFWEMPGMARNLSIEQYAEIVINHMPEQGGDGQPQAGQGSGEQGDDGQPQDGQGSGEQRGQALDPSQTGSNSDGQQREWEQEATATEEAMTEAAVAQVEQALARDPGSDPGNLRQAIGAVLRPQPDPFKILTRIAAKSVRSCVGEEQRTYRVLHRRQQAGQPRRLGAFHIRPECSVIIDTSGSMSGNEQRALTAIAQGIKAVQRPRVVAYDTKVQSAKHLTSHREFEFVGYGGTAMFRAIETEDREQRPDAILVVTDGETRWPATPPRARLVIALVSEPRMPLPKYGRVVRLYEEHANAH